MTSDNIVDFQVRLSDAETKAWTWSIADTDYILKQLEWDIPGITSNKQLQNKKEFTICLIEIKLEGRHLAFRSSRKPLNYA